MFKIENNKSRCNFCRKKKRKCIKSNSNVKCDRYEYKWQKCKSFDDYFIYVTCMKINHDCDEKIFYTRYVTQKIICKSIELKVQSKLNKCYQCQ